MNDKVKNILKIMGYVIGGFLLCYLLLIYFAYFMLKFKTFVKIMCLLLAIFVFIIQIVHYYNTKIKKILGRFLIFVGVVIFSSFVIDYSYGVYMNYKSSDLLDDIRSIEFNNFRFEKNDLSNAKVRYVNDNFVLSKGSYELIICYDDGTVEKSVVSFNGIYMFKINGEYYYIDNLVDY